ncbi:MAG: pantoate--beta-alanine ligase [Candidatus Cloacimonadota bacterium]|nr:MAG: pantoate--beta-alanine ligase [Candidatus Cloacimonadota bacterium]
MQIINTIIEVNDHLDAVREKGLSIGFVPTMGALHEGHLSLIREARKENDFVVCSIFVNPEQFNNKSDLENYPRNIEADVDMLNDAKCDLLFFPSELEMQPKIKTESFDFGGLEKVMEGKFRPGHFNGVATIVKVLFEIIEPQRAYFGMKDYQQVVIIHKMTKDSKLPVEIIPCPTVREEDGLAMSSRNQLLSKSDRKQAATIFKVLKMIKIHSGFSTINEIKEYVESQFRKSKNAKLEYFEIVDMYSLKPLKAWAESNNVIACTAVYIGDVRLIDNIILFS